MKRDSNAPSITYFSPPSPNITFNAYNIRSAQRESGPVEPLRQQDAQHRYSNNVEHSQPNNAFAHLRSQISNLRSQFTRLIQKDINGDKLKDDKVKLGSIHKQERVAAHSTIGFYNQGESKPEQKGEYYFKNKLALNEQRGSVDNGQTQKRPKQLDNGTNVNKYHKKYSFQTQDRRDQTSISQVIDHSKIHQLEIQIRKLGQIKHKVEEENIHLKKQITKIEKDLQSKINGLEFENANLKNSIQQAQISISLKQSLVQKLQNDYCVYKNSVQDYEQEARRLKTQLQAVKQQLSQVKYLQSINHELFEKQKHSRMALDKKEEQCNVLKQQRENYQKKYREQINVIETFQNSIKDLQSQHELINQQYRAIQLKYQETVKHEDDWTAKMQQKIKMLEDENVDLKKRVESYKKTVEQLNSSNNSSRQKLVGLKEQARKAKQQAKFFAEQLQVKDKLITSLYRDINILDSQIRHNSHIKIALTNHLKYIDELTQRIIELQCSKLNQKYLSLDNEAIQYS